MLFDESRAASFIAAGNGGGLVASAGAAGVFFRCRNVIVWRGRHSHVTERINRLLAGSESPSLVGVQTCASVVIHGAVTIVHVHKDSTLRDPWKTDGQFETVRPE